MNSICRCCGSVAYGVALILLMFSFQAHAWMGSWAPKVDAKPAPVMTLSEKSVRYFINNGDMDREYGPARFSKGVQLDLNDDGINDFAFIEPWMGNGLNAAGSTIHFIVSDGNKKRKITSFEGYGIEPEDLVKIDGRVYFRHSMFFEDFENSRHNHWVHQLFAFGKDGVLRNANADFGGAFPAVTIYYDKPKFKPIDLTATDLKVIEETTTPVTKKYE